MPSRLQRSVSGTPNITEAAAVREIDPITGQSYAIIKGYPHHNGCGGGRGEDISIMRVFRVIVYLHMYNFNRSRHYINRYAYCVSNMLIVNLHWNVGCNSACRTIVAILLYEF